MAKFSHLMQDTVLRNLVQEFVVQHSTQKQFLSEAYNGLESTSNLYAAIQLGEQTANDIQVDIVCEYLNDHPVLKEDIFQRGAAKTKAWLTTPLGKGFGQAKETQVIQNLFNTFKKNTEKLVAQPSPFTPSAEDAKKTPAEVGLVGALIGKRFAALQNNPRLNVPATPAEQQAGMGRIEQLIAKLRASGLVKGADTVLDEIGIFARQHPTLVNMIISGLVSVSVLATGPLAAIPMLAKFVVGVALRTLTGVLKGEKASQAASKAAVVSGAGIALGKLLGLFYDKLAGWLVGDADGSALPVPAKPGVPQPTQQGFDTTKIVPGSANDPNQGMYAGGSASAGPGNWQQGWIAPEDINSRNIVDLPDGNQYDAAGNRIFPTPPTPPAPAAVPPGNVLPPQPTVTGVDIPQAPAALNLAPKINALNSLISSTDVKGATAPAARQAVLNWVNGVTQPEAQAMLQNPNIVNQLMRKGALGALKQKFGLQETAQQAEVDYLKTELMAGAAVPMIAEANPFTAAKNFMFGGPQVGGKNSRLDFKQVESDYLKFLNNMRSQLGLQTEKDVLDVLRRYDKTFPGVYDYVKKVRDWLFGPTPEANAPLPEPLTVPPQEIPTPTNPNPGPNNPTKPEDLPPEAPKPGDPAPKAVDNKLDANKIKAVKAFLSRIIDLGDVLTRTNPAALNKAVLRDLATNVYTLGDVMVNKKVVGKINPIVDKATQGLDLLGQQPEQKPAQPVSNVFKEADAADVKVAYKNAELTKQIAALKNNPVFKNLPQRLQTLMAAKYTDVRSVAALKTFLNVVYNSMVNNSAAFQQAVGNPVAIKKELESDKEYLKEATAAEIQGFVGELNTALAAITKLAGELRQAFNRKNPNNVYVATPSQTPQPQQSGFVPKEKTLITLRVPPQVEDTGGLSPKALYQYFNGKWNVVQANGLQPLDPKNSAKQIAKLNALAKDGRNDYDKAISLMKTDPKDKGAGINYDVGSQVKEYFNITDYRKFFM